MNYDALSHDDTGKEHIQREKLESISQALLQTVSLSVAGKNFAILLLWGNWNRNIYTWWVNMFFKRQKQDFNKILLSFEGKKTLSRKSRLKEYDFHNISSKQLFQWQLYGWILSSSVSSPS